jgi:hypothetical protein
LLFFFSFFPFFCFVLFFPLQSWHTFFVSLEVHFIVLRSEIRHGTHGANIKEGRASLLEALGENLSLPFLAGFLCHVISFQLQSQYWWTWSSHSVTSLQPLLPSASLFHFFFF